MQNLLTTFLSGATKALPGNDDRTAREILDATLLEAASRGLRALPMEGIARRAGVNRGTLYRRFGDRDGVVAALAAREGQRVRAALAEATDGLDDPADRLVEGFVAAVRYANAHPLVRRAAELEPETLIAAGLADDARLLRIGADVLAAEIRTAQAEGLALHLTDPDQAGETLARLFASFVLLPGGAIDLADEDAMRSYARNTLVPMLLGPR